MTVLTADQVLSLVPQQKPMRFIDKILELDEDHILGRYTWTAQDCAGFLPGSKVVPGFKLVEMAAQIGNVSWCIYHMAMTTAPAQFARLVGFLTEVRRGVCTGVVHPGDTVACLATFDDEGYFRGNKLVSRVEMQIEGGPRDGQEVFSGLISGMWVPR